MSSSTSTSDWQTVSEKQCAYCGSDKAHLNDDFTSHFLRLVCDDCGNKTQLRFLGSGPGESKAKIRPA